MQYRPLGRTGLNVSLASLGTGGDSRLGQSTHGSLAESTRVVRRALELGINLIDTAPSYMESERLLGEALAGVPRDSYLLSTKVSPRREGKLVEPEQVTASCEESLRRLGTDFVDVLMFHGVTRAEYPGIAEELWPAAKRLQEQGKVRFIGVTEPMPGSSYRNAADGPAFDSAFGHEVVTQAARDGIWDLVMLKYGLLDQSARQTALAALGEANLGVMVMSAVRGSIVRPSELEALIAEWKSLGLLEAAAVPETDPLSFLAQDGVPSIRAAGYRFVVEDPEVSTVTIGTGSVEHLEESVADVLAGPLPAALRARARELFGEIVAERA
jgi:L-galactose dehydrogenase